MDITERILAEYRYLPGLRATALQAARRWALEVASCECLLNQLVADGHLFIDARGQYAWTGRAHVPHASRPEPGVSEAVA